MNYTTVKVPTITMEELTKLQNEYMFFDKILKKLRTKRKRLQAMVSLSGTAKRK